MRLAGPARHDRAGWWLHPLLLPAALGLAACAGLAGRGAAQLQHTGAWTLITAAAVLAAAALGLATRQLWAFAFALLFWAATAAGSTGLGVFLLWQGLTNQAGGDWSGLVSLLLAGSGLVAFAAAALSLTLAATLVLAWRPVMSGRSVRALLASLALAGAGLALIGGLGALLWQRQVFAQNECLGGHAPTCYRLAADAARFTSEQRRGFALRGCRAGDHSTCRQVVGFLEASGRSELRQAVSAACGRGDADLCHRLGERLLAIGDREDGVRHLERACAADARWCETAARTAHERGESALAHALRQRGCAATQAPACRALLAEARAANDAAEVARLELETCLIGDVNDCRPLMRRDLVSICNRVCAGATENLLHTCGYCARDALAAGTPALAEAWLSGACARGHGWSCRDLQELALARPSGAIAGATEPWPGK
jgi:ABC-type nickel/cobalt efflux system permease component RcnA